MVDFYDFLQISPNAEGETIRRVYHFLAARFHPDNQNSGDPEKFRLLKIAYDVLADPVRRAKYDRIRKRETVKPMSSSIDFLDSIEGELNRRMAVLAVLYYQRRRNPNAAEVSLKDIEDRMGFPRDYLDFTLWYLNKKNFITKADNASYTLTAEGVDFVEAERARLPVLDKLLTARSEADEPTATPAAKEVADWVEKIDVGNDEQAPGQSYAPAQAGRSLERRSGQDRRNGGRDTRLIKMERRRFGTDRRVVGNEQVMQM